MRESESGTFSFGGRSTILLIVDRITFNPEQCGGRPCIRGMRMRVKDVLDLLAAGVGEAEILEDYPYLEAEDIRACLTYAAAGVSLHSITSGAKK